MVGQDLDHLSVDDVSVDDIYVDDLSVHHKSVDHLSVRCAITFTQLVGGSTLSDLLDKPYPNPVFKEFVTSGVIWMHEICIMPLSQFSSAARCLMEARRVRHQTAPSARLC